MMTPKLSSEKAEPAHSGDRPTTAPAGQHTRNLRLRGPMAFLIFGILLVSAFSKPLFSLAVYAAGQSLDSHIVLIPFVSAYLIYIRRSSLPTNYTFSPGSAMIPFVAGVIALAAAWVPGVFGSPLSLNYYLALIALSFVVFLAAPGFFFLVLKSMLSAAVAFPVLIFILPVPVAIAH